MRYFLLLLLLLAFDAVHAAFQVLSDQDAWVKHNDGNANFGNDNWLVVLTSKRCLSEL